MPGFLFISGYFAKKIGEQGYLEKVSRKLLIPYFIFFAFFSFYYYFTGQTDKVTFDPFNPVFALWFLLTLFLFHVILVIVKDYKPYIVLPVAIIISLFAGFSSNINEYLSFSRTIIFSQSSILVTCSRNDILRSCVINDSYRFLSLYSSVSL